MAEAANNPNAIVYQNDDQPAQSFTPWPVERVCTCVDIIRRRMRGDRSAIDEETDRMMTVFFMLHPRMARMAASEKKADQVALDEALKVQAEVEGGSLTREDGNKLLMQRLVEGK